MIPYHQVVPWVETFLGELRGRGLAGNIVRDSTEAAGPPAGEVESWTGAFHQLAFVGEPDNYWLELRQFQNGHPVVINKEPNPNQFHMVVIAFCVAEG